MAVLLGVMVAQGEGEGMRAARRRSAVSRILGGQAFVRLTAVPPEKKGHPRRVGTPIA